MALLAEHPGNCVHHVGLPAAVRSDDARRPHSAERHHRPFAERLKARNFHFS